MKVLLLALALVVAVDAARKGVVIEPAMPLYQGWHATSRAVPDKTAMRTVLVGIKQQNLDKLEEAFWKVSCPKSASYGKHWTADEITALIAPKPQHVSAVCAWVDTWGVPHQVLRNQDWIQADLSLAQIEAIFDVSFSVFRHDDGTYAVGTVGPYRVPSELAGMIDIVTGITGMPGTAPEMYIPASKTSDSDSPYSGSTFAITPEVIFAAYNIPSGTVPTASGNSHAVAEFQAQYYSENDTKAFFDAFVTWSTDYKVDALIGWNNPTGPSLEASLDIQYAMSLAPNVDFTVYVYRNFNFFNDLNVFLAGLSNASSIPLVITISYGLQGSYPSHGYQARSDTEYQKVGLRGTSIIYASGDRGACGDGHCSRLEASYPATSVYVTSVGATRFLHGTSGQQGAVDTYFHSGGGFSGYFPQPSYQASAVAAYLATPEKTGFQLPNPSTFNASCRATPDVAALGEVAFQVYVGGELTTVGGTSAAAPTFGAVITLLNDARLNKNKASLGFLNPWLYQTAAAEPTAFTDITVGDNIGCVYTGSTYEDGYPCGFTTAPGWDPVTGLGTPNYAVLVNYV